MEMEILLVVLLLYLKHFLLERKMEPKVLFLLYLEHFLLERRMEPKVLFLLYLDHFLERRMVMEMVLLQVEAAILTILRMNLLLQLPQLQSLLIIMHIKIQIQTFILII